MRNRAAEMIERVEWCVRELNECVDVDPEIRGGVPVIKGTRVPVAMVLADIADGRGVQEEAHQRDMDPAVLKRILDAIATCLDRPFVGKPPKPGKRQGGGGCSSGG